MTSVNGFGASPDGLGQYDVNRAGDFGGTPDGLGFFATQVGCGQNNWTRLAICAAIGAAIGAAGGAAVGMKKSKVGKGAAIGGAVGAAAYALLCQFVPCEAPKTEAQPEQVPAAQPEQQPLHTEVATLPAAPVSAAPSWVSQITGDAKPPVKANVTNWQLAEQPTSRFNLSKNLFNPAEVTLPQIRGFGAYYAV
jgi:hypothetical protein